MKAVSLALLVLVVVSQGEALRCYCGGTTKPCSSSVETCYGSGQVCGNIILQAGSHVSYIQGCMSSSDCSLLSDSPTSSGDCCRTDLCNR